MPVPSPSIAFALFDDRGQAEAAVGALREAGLADDQVELTGCDDGPAGRVDENGGLLSPVRTLLLGGKDTRHQLYQQLVELGIDEDEARYFRDEVDRGRILVTVISMRREREAANILRMNGGRSAFEDEPTTSESEGSESQVVREDIANVDSSDDIRTS